MKKFVSLALALVLVLALSITTFAATLTATGTATDVNATYAAGLDGGDIVSVDVTWTEANFAYTSAAVGTWQPGDHSYANSATEKWTGSQTYTVTNHSNVDVTATLTFEGVGAVTGSFALQDEADTTLEAGVVGEYANADKYQAILTLAGTMTEPAEGNSAKVGTVTLTIA